MTQLITAWKDTIKKDDFQAGLAAGLREAIYEIQNQPSEIPVKYACSMEGDDVYGLFKADEKGRHCGMRIAQLKGYSNMKAVLELLNRTTEPVSVSLEKCGDAILLMSETGRSSEWRDKEVNNIAKAVLDAAGVPYHEG